MCLDSARRLEHVYHFYMFNMFTPSSQWRLLYTGIHGETAQGQITLTHQITLNFNLTQFNFNTYSFTQSRPLSQRMVDHHLTIHIVLYSLHLMPLIIAGSNWSADVMPVTCRLRADRLNSGPRVMKGSLIAVTTKKLVRKIYIVTYYDLIIHHNEYWRLRRTAWISDRQGMHADEHTHTLSLSLSLRVCVCVCDTLCRTRSVSTNGDVKLILFISLSSFRVFGAISAFVLFTQQFKPTWQTELWKGLSIKTKSDTEWWVQCSACTVCDCAADRRYSVRIFIRFDWTWTEK